MTSGEGAPQLATPTALEDWLARATVKAPIAQLPQSRRLAFISPGISELEAQLSHDI